MPPSPAMHTRRPTALHHDQGRDLHVLFPARRPQPAGSAHAGRPLNELAKLGPDIAQRWRNGDAEAVDTLAAPELKRLGLSVSGRRR